MPSDAIDPLSTLQGLPRGATVLLLGGTDTGKTTFIHQAVTSLTAVGLTVALVDCDLGQSEIGPPGTVGAALARPGGEYRTLRSLTPSAAYFVGATSPVRHLLDVCVGAVQMARVVKKQRPDLLLVDTDGFVAGPVARTYKRRLAELLLPGVVLAFARGDELDPLLTVFAHLETPNVRRIVVSASVQRKTSATRVARRSSRFLSALAGAETVVFSFDDVGLQNTLLGAGTPLPHHLLQFLSQSLRRPVLHAERGAAGLYVVVDGDRWDASGAAAIESHFQTRSLTIVAAQKFSPLLVGLIGVSGMLLGLGLIESLDFGRRTVSILTPCRKPRAVAQIWLGSLRLRPDGRELGELRPGEV